MIGAMAPRKEVTLSLFSFLFLVILALGLGSFYRFPGLERRPMHTDEAILAVKLSDFWQTGHFQYDPKDFHGPALHQVSWLWGKVAGWGDPMTWTESDLRLVCVLCGMGLLLVTLLFADALGRFGTAMAMLMCAVSPMMVFYSRYFIMEMLLVLLVALMLGCFWRYSQNGTRLWLLLGGCALGFQHATKETFVLNVGAAVAGWAVARVLVGEFQPRKGNGLSLGPARLKGRPARPWLWVLVPALLISVAAFSGLFRDWTAVKDSALTYLNYLERSGGSGHEKPWHYYLSLIFWRKDTLVWSEAMIGGLAVIGMIYSIVGEFKNTGRQAFLVFLSVYALVLFAGYSLLSYKTPWSILSGQYALTLLAGLGAGAVWSGISNRFFRLLWSFALTVGLYHLCYQTMLAIGNYRADQRNPYVYSHTSTDLLRLVAEVQKVAAERGEDFQAQVINRDAGWPLPWYLRTLSRVGYQTTVPEELFAPVIIADADLQPLVQAQLAGREYEERGPYGLRPGVYLTMFVAKPKPPPATPVPVLPVEPPASPLEMSLPPAGTISAPPTFSPTLPVLPGSLPLSPQ